MGLDTAESRCIYSCCVVFVFSPKGTTALTWPLLAKNRGAILPPIRTVALPRDAGNGRFAAELLLSAKRPPKTAMMLPGATEV